MRLHCRLGSVPTVTERSAADIERPNEGVAEMLDLARYGRIE